MKIFVDFDGVILDTKKFVFDLNEIYSKNGISNQRIKEHGKIFSGAPKVGGITYKPERAVAFLVKDDKMCQKKILSEANIFLKELKDYVFPDALIFLKTFSKRNLILLSYGDIKFQEDKIFGSGTDGYFSEIIIDERNKMDIISKIIRKDESAEQEKIFLIDDKIENLEKIEKTNSEVITIWINRTNIKDDRCVNNIVGYEAKDLMEAVDIIMKTKDNG